jgi:hypothetical protein
MCIGGFRRDAATRFRHENHGEAALMWLTAALQIRSHGYAQFLARIDSSFSTWSNTDGRWRTFGNFGRMKLMLESAREIVENDPMYRVPHAR